MKSIILAIILIESSFNPKAYNKEGKASGLMQLTRIGVKEASIQCKLHPKPDLFNPEVNIKYGTCLFEYYRKISRSEVEALLMYHGGGTARNRFREGKNPGKKTALYVNKVLDLKERIENEEFDINKYCRTFDKLIGELCRRKDSDGTKSPTTGRKPDNNGSRPHGGSK